MVWLSSVHLFLPSSSFYHSNKKRRQKLSITTAHTHTHNNNNNNNKKGIEFYA